MLNFIFEACQPSVQNYDHGVQNYELYSILVHNCELYTGKKICEKQDLINSILIYYLKLLMGIDVRMSIFLEFLIIMLVTSINKGYMLILILLRLNVCKIMNLPLVYALYSMHCIL